MGISTGRRIELNKQAEQKNRAAAISGRRRACSSLIGFSAWKNFTTGSGGRPKDGDPRAGYCVLTIDSAQVTTEQVRLEYDVEDACSRLIAVGLPDYFADYLRLGGNLPMPE